MHIANTIYLEIAYRARYEAQHFLRTGPETEIKE